MKRLLYLIFAFACVLLSAASCTPQIFTMDMQLRRPSSSGLNLSGKSLGVVYVSDGRDSVYAKNLAEGFAASLEDDYFGGEQLVDVYQMQKSPDAGYASRDTMVNLIMDTDKDVIFVFDNLKPSGSPVLVDTETSEGASKVYLAKLDMPVAVYVYDSMAKDDTVRVFAGKSGLDVPIVGDGHKDVENVFWSKVGPAASALGRQSSSRFLSTWAPVKLGFYYYDSSAWDKAARLAYDYRWHDAITIWMDLAKSGSGTARACAAYNIAAAFYVLGDYHTAGEWLTYSDSVAPTELSFSLRSKIDAALKY